MPYDRITVVDALATVILWPVDPAVFPLNIFSYPSYFIQIQFSAEIIISYYGRQEPVSYEFFRLSLILSTFFDIVKVLWNVEI